jgi:hypothetical protein
VVELTPLTEDVVKIFGVEKKEVIIVFQEEPWKLVCGRC